MGGHWPFVAGDHPHLHKKWQKCGMWPMAHRFKMFSTPRALIWVWGCWGDSQAIICRKKVELGLAAGYDTNTNHICYLYSDTTLQAKKQIYLHLKYLLQCVSAFICYLHYLLVLPLPLGPPHVCPFPSKKGPQNEKKIQIKFVFAYFFSSLAYLLSALSV